MSIDARPTLHDVARRAHVSKSTVSRVINDHPYVEPATRRAVRAAMVELGYQPNEVARSLRSTRTRSIGLLVTRLRNEVFAAIAQGVDKQLSAASRTLLIGSSNDDPDHEMRILQDFARRGIDGIIMSLTDERARAVRAQIARLGVPVVLLDRDGHGLAVDRVLSDHFVGVTEAVRDLRAHGHEAIALLCAQDNVRPGREVQAAFMLVAQDQRFVRSGLLTEDLGYAATHELFGRADRPSAMVVTGIQVLTGVLSALEELGLSIPQDVSLVAYDDSAATRFHSPPISVIMRDTECIGEIAAQLVLERVDGQREKLREVVVPTRYVRRGSVVAGSSSPMYRRR